MPGAQAHARVHLPPPVPLPLPTEQTALLADFARACKAGIRSVSLYPPTHPAIRAALARLASITSRLTAAGDVTLAITPHALSIDGRIPARPDGALAELAALLHVRLVGELHIQPGADGDDWLALLLVVARQPEALLAEGGIARAWAASGRGHFAIREIDYAEVLRERAAGEHAAWERIVAHCLRGQSEALDERALAFLLDAVRDPERFAAFLDRLQEASAPGVTMGARAAALVRILRAIVAEAAAAGEAVLDEALETMAGCSRRLEPDMLLALLERRGSADPEDAAVASAIAERIDDPTAASFVARSVAAERGATDRLAHALEALVPDAERKERLLQLAGDELRQGDLGREAGFEDLWRGAAEMLRSYSDDKYVPAAYARELSASRSQAIDVERTSDDPPERIEQWVATVSDAAMQRLDLDLLIDLLRLEDDPSEWTLIAGTAAAEIERRTLLDDIDGAQQIADAVVREAGPDGRTALAASARATAARLAAGPLVRHLVARLRTASDGHLASLGRLFHTIGAAAVGPLAEALAAEEHPRAIRGLREILLGFGAAGRRSVEQLKSSPNPAVRRTAIDLLRVFGGDDALPELASMLGDADPQVQREAIRAIVQIGSQAAYHVLEQRLMAPGAALDAIVQQLIGLRDDKAVPLLCYVLNHTPSHGRMGRVHLDVIEALGGMNAHPDATRALRDTLHRGSWWTPVRTAARRAAAAAALERIDSADARAVLEDAARTGSRGVRRVARAHARAAVRTRRDPS